MAARKNSRKSAAHSMPSKRSNPPAPANAKSAAKTSARSTVSGPARSGGDGSITDAASAKLEGTQAVAAAFPHNAAKPSEFADGGMQPAKGQTVEPPHPMVSGSTLTEINASEKVGSGNPQMSFNPGNGPLDRVRVDSGGRVLTTNQGVPIADNQNSLKAGLRGPTLLEDFILREKITHFDHERIPERIVHARGSGAHGYFECYEPLAPISRVLRCSPRPASARRCSFASRRSRASAARRIRRAMCAASRSSSTPTKAIWIWSATTSRSSSFRTR